MARDHKARPTFDELTKELKVLLEAHQRGSDLNALPAAGLTVPPPLPNGKNKRALSLQRPPLPEVCISRCCCFHYAVLTICLAHAQAQSTMARCSGNVSTA